METATTSTTMHRARAAEPPPLQKNQPPALQKNQPPPLQKNQPPPLEKDQPPLPFTPAQVAFPAALLARPVDRAVLAVRAARVAFGAALVAGAALLVVSAVARFPIAHAPQILAGTWITAAAAAAVAFAVVRLRPARGGRAGDRLLFASLAWPVAGLALLLPLTSHVLFASTAADFDKWVQMSFVIVGHAHVALAAMGVRRMRRLVDGERAMPAPAIYGVVVGVSMVPGVFLLLIPPVVVAITGLPFLFLLSRPARIIARERARLA